MTAVVEVRFKGNRLEYFNWSAAEALAPHDPVIVEVERGQDLGRVSAIGDTALKKCARGCGDSMTVCPATPANSAGAMMHPACDRAPDSKNFA